MLSQIKKETTRFNGISGDPKKQSWGTTEQAAKEENWKENRKAIGMEDDRIAMSERSKKMTKRSQLEN